jgi:hypothetical protein
MVTKPEDAIARLLEFYRDSLPYLIRADKKYRSEPNDLNLGSRIPEQLQKFRTTVAWVRTLVKAYSDRVAIEDVTSSDDAVQKQLTEWLPSIKTMFREALTDALGLGSGYMRIVQLESSAITFAAFGGMWGAHYNDPDTGELLATMRVQRDPSLHRAVPSATPALYTAYTPGAYINMQSTISGDLGEQHSIPEGVLLVRPLVNRQRAGEAFGRPEGRDIWSIQDQASRALTALSIATDALAAPQRALIAAEETAYKDLTKAKLQLDSILTLAGDVKLDQWPAAQLDPFSGTLSTLGRQASAASGLPLNYWGLTSDANAASGDAIREDGTRVEIRARQLGESFANEIRLLCADALRMAGLPSDDVQVRMADPSTPTPGASVDAAVKLASIPPVANQRVVDRTMLWDLLRLDPETRRRIEDEDAEAAFTQLIANVPAPPVGQQPAVPGAPA